MQIEYGNWFIRIYKSEDITIEFEKENARNKKEAKREENNQHFSTELSIMMWMVEWMEDLHETARKKNSTKKKSDDVQQSSGKQYSTCSVLFEHKKQCKNINSLSEAVCYEREAIVKQNSTFPSRFPNPNSDIGVIKVSISDLTIKLRIKPKNRR